SEMKNMIFWRTFLYSLRLPKKQAVFKLNRIGMDITVVYMFILIGLISLPAMVNLLQADADIGINLFFWLIYFFILYYLPMTIGLFLLLSFIAWIGTGIAKLLRRKLRFALLG